MPSGNKMLVSAFHVEGERSYLDIHVYVSEKMDTEGLCGSFDSNPDNDVKHRVTGQTAGALSKTDQFKYIINTTVAKSWR